MIISLHISNYALIESVDIDFQKGFNIITGETGAGKSIMLDALGLIMGERADVRSVRDSSLKTVVEAVFGIENHPSVNTLLQEADIDTDPERCVMRREISPRGSSRAFINDTPVTLPLMRQVSLSLLDIHSQHQNLLLAQSDYQLQVLDALANNSELLNSYHKAYALYKDALDTYKNTRDAIAAARAEAEFIGFQLEQLEAVNLLPGEQAQLEHEREIVANATDIKQRFTAALTSLSDTPDTVACIAEAQDELTALADIMPEARDLSDRLQTIKIELQDVVETLNGINSRMHADPARLDEIEDRLSRIYTLEARHKVQTSDELITLRDAMRQRINTIEDGDNTLQQLEAAAKNAKKNAVLIARQLTETRVKAAQSLSNDLISRARPMGMDNLRCTISVAPVKIGPNGMDSVEFLFAFNKNQTLLPIGKTASGGEISRVMLALKSVIADGKMLPTLIFDEIDTGVSGDVANRMGRLMQDISQRSQVIAITHLPQVASRGQHHLKVYKADDDDATRTRISVLSPQDRLRELALMLSGDADNASALHTASELIEAAQR